MTWVSLNINFSYWQLGILFFLLILFCSFIVFVIISYFILKWIKINLDMHYFQVHDYNKFQTDILKKYGNKNIKKIYLVREPVNGITLTLINIITRYNFDTQLKKYKETQNKKIFFPKHTSIICEIETKNKNKKMLLLEKTNFFKIHTKFKVTDLQEIRQLKCKKKWTINKLLSTTQERMGKEKFFNWNICENNCQIFIKELLKTLSLCNKKNKSFLLQETFNKNINFTKFEHHVINCIINAYNLLDMFCVSIF